MRFGTLQFARVVTAMAVGMVVAPATAAASSLTMSMDPFTPETYQVVRVTVSGTADATDPRDRYWVDHFFDFGATSRSACAPTSAGERARITDGPDNHIGTTPNPSVGPQVSWDVPTGSYRYAHAESFLKRGPYVWCMYLEHQLRPTDADPYPPETTVATAALAFRVDDSDKRRAGARARLLARSRAVRACKRGGGGRLRVLLCVARALRRYPL